MIRLLAMLLGLAVLAGCAETNPEADPLADLGAYRLGYNVVVADKAKKGPISREATPEEWEGVLKSAVARRFGQYNGNQLYHFGISVEGYLLAPPGVPLVYTPKSALIINVTIWDDAAGRKLNDEPHQMTIFESTDAESYVLGSGHSRTKEEQIALLSFNAARLIEQWLAEQHEDHGWFTDNPTFNPPKKTRPQGDV